MVSEEAEKNSFSMLGGNELSAVQPNKSHFMRISSKLQQLNVDTRDEIYHQKLLFPFFKRTPLFDIEEARVFIGSY